MDYWTEEIVGLTAPAASSSTTTAIDRKAAYHVGRVTKTNSEWQPEHRSGESAIEESWDLAIARVRDAVRNNPILSKALSQMKTLVVGTGIQTFSDAQTPDGEELTEFVDESDIWFERWIEEEADADGDHHFYDMQSLSLGDTIEAGNHFLREVMLPMRNRTSPLAYQMLEWEQLARERDQPRGDRQNLISNGIEYDSRNIKVAYHFYDAHPYDTNTTSSSITRIPANQIIHNYIPVRSSGRCGMSWFAPMVQSARDIDYFLGNHLSSKALAALVALVVKSAKFEGQGGGGLDAEDSDTGVPIVKLGRPFVAEVGLNDSVELLQSQADVSDSQAFIDLMFTLQAMGSKLSLNTLLGDPQKANFGSIKSAKNDDEAMVAPIKRHQAHKIARKIRRRHIEVSVGLGLFKSVTATEYKKNRHRFNQLDHVAGAHPDIQPKDEGEAAIDRMRSGRTTYAYETGRLGQNWKRNIRAMAKVNRYAEEQGVVLDWTKGNGGIVEQSSSMVKTGADAKNGDDDD